MEHTRVEGRNWPFIAIATVLVVTVAALRWSVFHPFGIHWDESLYLNEAQSDATRLRGGMLITLLRGLFFDDPGRPPAFRLLALPVLAVSGFHTVAARLVSLACFGASAWFIYRATLRVATPIAAALAVLIFSLSPEVVSASIFFGTDAPLYLATSAMLYFVLIAWHGQSGQVRDWIGLGLAVGLGFLAKTSFLLIAGPVLIFWVWIALRGKVGLPISMPGWRAALVAVFVAAPWWLLNVRAAFAYTRYARGFVRNSLGPPGPATWIHWLNSVFQCLLGPASSILTALIVIVYLRKAIASGQSLLGPMQKAAAGACACAGVPIVLTQLLGTNHLLRHISPAIIPLAITVGVLADRSEWARARASALVSGILLCVQLGMLVSPVLFPNNHPVDLGFVNGALPWKTMARFDQWDWSPVRDIGALCGVETPKICVLGSGRTLDPPAIQYPWVSQASSRSRTSPSVPFVRWLWRYEDGPLDWGKVMDLAGRNDMAITPPRYIGEVRNKEDLDNQHNAEFAERLSKDPRFQGPIRLEMGRFEPVEVDVFVKRTWMCQSTTQR